MPTQSKSIGLIEWKDMTCSRRLEGLEKSTSLLCDVVSYLQVASIDLRAYVIV
jgi:hypothetical protein